MLCVPAESPDGSRRPTRGTNPHEHKTQWEVCTKRASTPHQKHASAQGDSLQVEGGWSYRIRVLAFCSCADKRSHPWINDGTVHSLSWGPYIAIVSGWVCVRGGATGAGLDVLCHFEAFDQSQHVNVVVLESVWLCGWWRHCFLYCLRAEEGESQKEN